MKGLILKDLITLKTYGKSLLLIFILFLFIGASSGSPLSGAMLVMPIAIMASFVTFSYDKYSNWDCYACTLPVNRNEIVKARYVVTFILCLLFLAFSLLSYTCLSLFMHNFSEASFLLPLYSILFGFVTILASIILTLNYKLGLDKARIALILIFILPSILTAFLTQSQLTMPIISEHMILLAATLLPIAAMLFLLLSYFISVRIYNQKEF